MPPLLIATEDDLMLDDLALLANALRGSLVCLPTDEAPLLALPSLIAKNAAAETTVILSETALVTCAAVDEEDDYWHELAGDARLTCLLAAGNIFARYGVCKLATLRAGLRVCETVYTVDPRDGAAAQMLGASKTVWLGLPVLISPGVNNSRQEAVGGGASGSSDGMPRIAVLTSGSALEIEAVVAGILLAATVANAKLFVPASRDLRETLAALVILPQERIRWVDSVPAALREATCGVMLDTSDGFGRDLAEAVIHDVAMVTTNAPTLALFCQTVSDVTGFSSLRETLTQYAWSPARRATQLERARRTLLDNFSAAALQARFATVTERE